MHNIVKKFLKYGVVTVEYPYKPGNSDFVTGRPVVDYSKCKACGACKKVCPTGAIVGDEKIDISIDRCIFCRFCEEECINKAVTLSSDFEMAVLDKSQISCSNVPCKSGYKSNEYEILGERLKLSIKNKFGRSLNVREVDAGSCNGCDNEANALNGPYNDISRLGVSFVASPRHADMLFVTGPVTKNMEGALVKAYNAMPDPKLVIAVGSCAVSGGMFAGSYACKAGVDMVIPVDAYVPGCPPRPQAMIYGILKVLEKIK